MTAIGSWLLDRAMLYCAMLYDASHHGSYCTVLYCTVMCSAHNTPTARYVPQSTVGKVQWSVSNCCSLLVLSFLPPTFLCLNSRMADQQRSSPVALLQDQCFDSPSVPWHRWLD